MEFKVKDLMKSPLITTYPNSTIQYIRELMERKGIQAIPIVSDSGNLDVLGIITATDLRGINDETQQVAEYMTKEIYRVEAGVDAEIAARTMLEDNVHHLIVEENGKVTGMLSSLDFVRLVAEIGYK